MWCSVHGIRPQAGGEAMAALVLIHSRNRGSQRRSFGFAKTTPISVAIGFLPETTAWRAIGNAPLFKILVCPSGDCVN
jgi:hypothetical protein